MYSLTITGTSTFLIHERTSESRNAPGLSISFFSSVTRCVRFFLFVFGFANGKNIVEEIFSIENNTVLKSAL